MSILTRINGIPVYTSIDKALEWGVYNGMSGYHIHKYKSVTGYMGGKNHASMPLKTFDLPVKKKGKPGYNPKIGSTVLSMINGKLFSTKVTPTTTYNAKGFPVLQEEEVGVDAIPVVSQVLSATPMVNQVAQQQSQPYSNPPVQRISNSPMTSGGGGGGGGGY